MIPKIIVTVIQYVKEHVHTQKSADFAIAYLRTRVLALTHSVKQTTMKPTPI